MHNGSFTAVLLWEIVFAELDKNNKRDKLWTKHKSIPESFKQRQRIKVFVGNFAFNK